MRCHYEVLEIARDATESEIKTGYKKLALKWHPDKNLDNPEQAKSQFQEVQQAYEVLIDRQERAWYDNHREQILHGSNKDYEDNCLDLFQYYTSSCYKGFTDEPRSFYSVYREVFEKISKEDLEFIESKDEFIDIPQFGFASSDYDSIVKPFYDYWMSYSTKRSYVWLDPYDIKEVRERKLLKLIEKENKKVRMKAKKERNDEVRNLVAFVRNRDKRVQENAKLLEQKAKENKKRTEELSKMARKDRREQMKASVQQQGEWTKFDNLKTELDEIEKNLMDQETDSSNSEDEDLYCVACNKVFKTPKAFQNHESSRKHKENIEKLKDLMLEEDEEYESIGSTSSLNACSSDHQDEEKIIDEASKRDERNQNISNVATISDIELDGDIHEKTPKIEKNKSKVEETNNCDAQNCDSEKENPKDLQNKDSEDYHKVAKEQGKVNKKISKCINEDVDTDEENGDDKQEDKEELSTTIKTRNKKQKKNKHILRAEESDVEIDISELRSKKIRRRRKSSTKEEMVEKPTVIEDKKKKIKKKPGRTEENDKERDEDLALTCLTCKNSFPSKNKLFEHLKRSGHGVFIEKSPQEVESVKRTKTKNNTKSSK